MSEDTRPQFFSYSFGDQTIDIPLAYDEQGRPKAAHYIYDGKVIEVPQEYDDQGRLEVAYYICGDAIQGMSLKYDDKGRPISGHLIFEHKIEELPADYDTIGDRVTLGVEPLRKTRIMVYDPGRRVTASCKSQKTYLDGEKGILLYCGYPIEQIASQCSYLETAYLLLHNELPTVDQLAEFEQDISERTLVHEQLIGVMNKYKRETHPMLLIHNMVAALEAFHNGTDITKPEDRYEVALNLIAKIPTVVSMAFRYKGGYPIVYPQKKSKEYTKNHFYTENYLRMSFLHPGASVFDMPPILIQGMDRLFTLHADHEQNASTSIVRDSGSTKVAPYAAIAAGIVTLWGPLHGGANEAALAMLHSIKSSNDISRLICQAKEEGIKIPGIGHAVYKIRDPRATILRDTYHEITKTIRLKDDVFRYAREMEERIESDPWFNERNIHPNVDFYSGLLMKAVNFPSYMFTANFVLPRMSGWIANWIEMIESGDMLSRPRQLYFGPEQRDVPPIELRGLSRGTSEERLQVQWATQHLG